MSSKFILLRNTLTGWESLAKADAHPTRTAALALSPSTWRRALKAIHAHGSEVAVVAPAGKPMPDVYLRFGVLSFKDRLGQFTLGADHEIRLFPGPEAPQLAPPPSPKPAPAPSLDLDPPGPHRYSDPDLAPLGSRPRPPTTASAPKPSTATPPPPDPEADAYPYVPEEVEPMTEAQRAQFEKDRQAVLAHKPMKDYGLKHDPKLCAVGGSLHDPPTVPRSPPASP